MPTCNILDFSLIQEYYTENISDPNSPRYNATNLCCYENLPMSYNTFVGGITDLYNSSCLRDREFSDYVTKLFTECLSGSSSTATTTDSYWSANTDGSISNSGLTETKVGIGTQVPSEMLSVSGNTNITNNLYVSGNTFYEGALSGTGNISTLGTVTTSNVITPAISNAAGDQIISVNTAGIDVTGPIDTNNNLYITGNTFYEGALSGTGNISTTDSLLVSGDTYFGSTVDVGIDGTGHDVTFYSNTSDGYFQWNASRNSIGLPDDVKIEMGTGSQFIFEHDSTANLIRLGDSPLVISSGTSNPNGNSIMVINTEQQVGIGTFSSSTTNRLHVSGTSTENPARIQTLQNAEGYMVVVDDNGVLYQSERSSEHATLWSAGTHDDNPTIVASGGTEPNIGIGTDSPNEILTVAGTVSGSTSISSPLITGTTHIIETQLSISGDTFYEGALSGTGNITTIGDIVIGGDVGVGGSITTNDNLYITGNTFYEGALSGTGNIDTVGDIAVGGGITSRSLTSTQNLYVSGSTFIEEGISARTQIIALGGFSGDGLTLSEDATIIFEGATNNSHETTLKVEDPTADRTITIPDATTQLVGRNTTDDLTNKSLVAPVIKSASADFAITFAISDDQENNVVLSFPIMPSNDTLVTTSLSETLTNKTLTTPVIAQVKPDGSATLTMPTATDTLVGKATTDTLTNKTMGDSLAMGTNKVTGLGDPTAAQDAVTRNYLSSTTATTYAYQYTSFFCATQGTSTDGGNWVLPSAGGGISNHTWNNDSGYAGTNDSIGDGPFAAPISDTQIAIPVPVDGFLVGFTCNCRNNGAASAPRNAGLFVSDGAPNWGTGDATPFYLRAFGAGDG